MSTDYRTVNRIVLHDHYTVLTTPDLTGDNGIFANFENETWRIEAEWVKGLLKAFGVELPRRGKYDRDLHIEIDRIPAHTGTHIYDDAGHKEIAGVGKIEAHILGANLLDLRLTYNVGTTDEFASEITYSGGFTVEWASGQQESA